MLVVPPDWRDAAKDRRVFLRLPASASAMLMSTALGRVPVTLVDLSQSGCRVTTRARCRRGDRFVLRIGGVEPRYVEAAWATEGEVGLAFAQPLAWPVVAGIAFSGEDGG